MPGNDKKVPKTGKRLKKFTAIGKKPLKKEKEINSTRNFTYNQTYPKSKTKPQISIVMPKNGQPIKIIIIPPKKNNEPLTLCL